MELKAKEIDLARQLIENLTEAFDIKIFQNDYITKLEEMLEARIHGRKLTVVKPAAKPKVVDLMEALQKSIQLTRENRPMARAEERGARGLKKIR